MDIKDRVIAMFKYGYSIHKICNTLNLKRDEVELILINHALLTIKLG